MKRALLFFCFFRFLAHTTPTSHDTHRQDKQIDRHIHTHTHTHTHTHKRTLRHVQAPQISLLTLSIPAATPTHQSLISKTPLQILISHIAFFQSLPHVCVCVCVCAHMSIHVPASFLPFLTPSQTEIPTVGSTSLSSYTHSLLLSNPAHASLSPLLPPRPSYTSQSTSNLHQLVAMESTPAFVLVFCLPIACVRCWCALLG